LSPQQVSYYNRIGILCSTGTGCNFSRKSEFNVFLIGLPQASRKGYINYGSFLERFINGKRLIIMNLFIWLSKNRFTIVVLVENRFTNHKRVHNCEPFLAVVK